MSTYETAAKALLHFPPTQASRDALEEVLRDNSVTIAVGATAAGDALTVIGAYFPVSVRVTSLVAIPTANVTADATDYATVSIAHDDAASPGTDVALGSHVFDTPTTDNWVADTAETIAVTAANSVLPAGSLLKVSITKTASGLATPNFALHVTAERI